MGLNNLNQSFVPIFFNLQKDLFYLLNNVIFGLGSQNTECMFISFLIQDFAKIKCLKCQMALSK